MQLILLVAVTLLLDQGSKFLVSTNFYQGQSIPLIENVFHLTFVRNPGAAFGLLAYRTTFFIAITVLVTVIILVMYFKLPREKKLLRFALALQLGGAFGNLIDRLRSGFVVDFLDFRVWPVFNFSDVAIVIGVVLLAYELLWHSEEGKEV